MEGSQQHCHNKPLHWDAADYAANSSAQYQWGSELIAQLGLRGHEDVLDLGSGDGKLTAMIANQLSTGSVAGVDASAQMVALAQQRWGDMPNVTFAQADAQQLAFRETVDVVFSNAVLHWVPDHPAVLVGMYRALRPGGRIVLQMGGAGNCARFIEAVDRVRATSRWQRFFRDFSFPWSFNTEADYNRWLDEAGLVAHRIDTVHKDMCHDSPEQLAGWMRSTWLPYLQCVPKAERAAFVASVVDAYLRAVPADAAGHTHVDMVRLEVTAEKL